MSKNLGNIPRQVKMTEEQEQTFTNGINKGRKLERELITYLLAEEIENVSNPMLVDREYLDGLERALEIVNGENK